MSNTLYKAAIKEMLFGRQFICEHSNDSLYRYLSDPYHLTEVNDYLNTMDRVVRTSADGDSYFLSYLHPDEGDYQKACKQLYQQLLNDLYPFLQLVTTLMHCQNGTPIRPGDHIKESQLLAGFEQSKTHTDSLNLLTRAGLFYSSSPQVKGQLAQVLNKLQEHHYLLPIGHSSTQYIATGKWAMLYDFIDFQFTNEHIELLDDELNEQAELL